jgi:hypothetical protein
MSKAFTQRVIDWNLAAGNTADQFNVRQTALYIGLQIEELAHELRRCSVCEKAMRYNGRNSPAAEGGPVE